MQIKLTHPFTHDGMRYEQLEVPDYIQVGHRRAYAKHKDLEKEEAGIALCAALCELSESAFDKLSLQDFERVTTAVHNLFKGAAEKKSNSPKRKGTLPRP